MKELKLILISFVLLISTMLILYIKEYKIKEPILNTPINIEESNNKEEYKINEAESLNEIKNYIKNNETSIIVYGKNYCNYCKKYIPVLEKISKNYDFYFLYVNLTTISEEEYHNIMNSDIVIPAKCTDSGKERKLGDGFGTPLTLIYKNGTIADCIRGYKSYDKAIELLKEANALNKKD